MVMLTENPKIVYSKRLKEEIKKVSIKRKDGKIVDVWPWTTYQFDGLKKPQRGR